jgi:hypothetical protein
VAATAQELIGGHRLVAFQLPLLANLLLLNAKDDKPVSLSKNEGKEPVKRL